MISINLEKAKAISHDIRREARAGEFAPHDEVIAKQIPGAGAAEAEAARQAIRDKYVIVQAQIDDAEDVETLKAIVTAIVG